MPETLKITFEGDHIRVVSQSDKADGWARDMWVAIVAACNKHSCFKVMGVSDATSLMSIMEGFDFVELFRELGITTKYRIAWVELNPAAVKTVKFVDSALFNRMLPGRLFGTEGEAKAWLLEDKGY